MKSSTNPICALLLSTSLLGTILIPFPASAGEGAPHEVYAARQELGARDLWPGFDARIAPLAIYDGEATWLFGHPQPPEGFQPLPDSPTTARYDGRHPAVTANSSAEMGGLEVGTLIPAVLKGGARSAASTAIHETFHVFQRERHPGWSANEVDFFTYPAEDARLLALRRQESLTLSRGVASTDKGEAACWARAALEARRERFAAMAPESVTYERKLELFEGLAEYLEYRATGRGHGSADGIFPPEGVRWRVYWSGHALARLLDQTSGEWRQRLEHSDEHFLDEMLKEALDALPAEGPPCTLSPQELKDVESRASEDVADLQGRRKEAVREALDSSGWKIVLESPGSPLWPQGFDPLNLESVGGGRVLHTRFLKLGNDATTLEMLNHTALTEAAGSHPLFQGVRRVVIPGLAEKPAVDEEEGVVRISAGAVKVEATGAAMEIGGETILLRWESPPSR